jgi:hypothetical protein
VASSLGANNLIVPSNDNAQVIINGLYDRLSASSQSPSLLVQVAGLVSRSVRGIRRVQRDLAFA